MQPQKLFHNFHFLMYIIVFQIIIMYYLQKSGEESVIFLDIFATLLPQIVPKAHDGNSARTPTACATTDMCQNNLPSPADLTACGHSQQRAMFPHTFANRRKFCSPEACMAPVGLPYYDSPTMAVAKSIRRPSGLRAGSIAN